MEIRLAQLGDEVVDKVSGFRGIVTGVASYISGCDQVSVTARLKKDGGEPAHMWFDIGRAKVKIAGKVSLESVQVEKTGGPQNSPPKG